jgi:hypothetical protein
MQQRRMYHDGSRQLQDQFGSRQISDRLAEKGEAARRHRRTSTTLSEHRTGASTAS